MFYGLGQIYYCKDFMFNFKSVNKKGRFCRIIGTPKFGHYEEKSLNTYFLSGASHLWIILYGSETD